MDDGDSVGARIAAERRLRGLTQQQLAQRANVSVSLLRKIERGDREVTHGSVAALAAALGVEPNALTGAPYRFADRRLDGVHDLVPAVRRELVSFALPPNEDRETPAMADLRRSVADVSAARHAVDLSTLGERLPSAMADLRAAAWDATGTEREEVMRLRCETLYATRQFLHKLGYADLASLVADRYEWAADQAGDPLARALSDVFRAGELDAAADTRGAVGVMSRTIEKFDVPVSFDSISVLGFVHLMAAWNAAHTGDADAVWTHYAEAQAMAERLGRDGNSYETLFGPTNVAVWGVALGVELQDAPAALAHADRVHLGPDVAAERAGHHWLDVGRARLLNNDRRGALAALQAARSVAPQQTRHHPAAREAVRSLARAERRSSESLRSLGAWMRLGD